MRKFFTFGAMLSLALFGVGCNSSSEKPLPSIVPIQPTTSTDTTSAHTATSTQTVYSVDEFAMSVFKQGGRIRILIESVTCYNSSCGFDGREMSIGLNQEESGPFLSLSGKETSFVIEAEAACPKESTQCNKIKNVQVVNQ